MALVLAPAVVAANPLTPFAYVTGSGPGAGVAVINTSTNAVVADVATPAQAEGVATMPNGALAYVTMPTGNGVAVINTSTNAVVATVPLADPSGIAITPNGAFAYVIANSNVAVINTATNTVVATVPVSGGPYRVAITPNGAFAYVTIPTENKVAVIDTAANAVVATVPVGHFPEGVAVTPDGAFAYVTNLLENSVSVIDTSTNAVVATVPVSQPPYRVAITPNGALAYVTGDNSSVSVISTATNAVIANVPIGGTWGVAITPNGAFAYTATADSKVAVIDTSTNAVVATVVRGNSGDGSEVAITPPIVGPVTATVDAPVVKILSGPPKETAKQKATFTFAGVAGGSYECSIDAGAWSSCKSGQSFGPLLPGDHLFRVRETLNGITGPAAGYRWTIDLPRACVLRVARARVFAFTHQHRARLVIRYKTYRPAEVTVSYRLAGSRGILALGSASSHFATTGVFRLPESLSGEETAKLRATKSMKVQFKIPKTPGSCARYYSKKLTIPKRVYGQTVWFQSDSVFAP